MDTIELLDQLVAFKTVSKDSNLPLVDFAESFLRERGFICRRVLDPTGLKANLIASIGPGGADGIILSAHTDVVPVAGQAWSGNPFRLRRDGDRLYGRGTADMKGFVAAALRIADRASRLALGRSLHIALSHDEEIGCVGVRSLLSDLKDRRFSAALCIVGEPTSMRIGIGHKGKLAARATCWGRGGHSSIAPLLMNAIHLATDVTSVIRRQQSDIGNNGLRDEAYDVPYTTIHAGKIVGGTALNVVPDVATVDFEIRHLAEDDPTILLERLQSQTEALLAPHRMLFPEAAIGIEVLNAYPAFAVSPTARAVTTIKAWLPEAGTTKVSFGTEAGLYVATLGIPTVVIGPGSMDQGHTPDEFVDVAQLHACDAFLDRMLVSLGRRLRRPA
ncbi:acetylornithine deacetylase [Rhizobium calliandrae]|uniref:Acetylornithine deacetylase n=2 Tax=Rhizobium calliandrae TaxID=1312182 RepID=A0ABT7KLS1_9HYPH|nr:acetylornithine deacetylase [Rhizobium calliandrae]MDL2409588.1 acetylornithine deacetylase [Rhizobium calliandrae]